jgi:hypothetical protein
LESTGFEPACPSNATDIRFAEMELCDEMFPAYQCGPFAAYIAAAPEAMTYSG